LRQKEIRMGIKTKKLIVTYILSLFFFIPSMGQNGLSVGTVNVNGNFRTKTDIILRELDFKKEEKIPLKDLERILDRSKQNIINTNLFLTVDFLPEILTDSFNLEINVKERWYLVALPEVYLADRNINEWWYDRGRDLNRLTYGVTAKHFNLTGNNDQLRLKAFGGFIPYFEASYNKPYIDKRKRIGLRTGAFYTTQRSMPFRTWNDKLDFFATEDRMRERYGAFFELKLRNALYHFHTLFLGFTHTNISDTISVLNPAYFGPNNLNQNLLTLIYDYRFDKRDNRQYPLKGHIFYGQISNFIYKTDKFDNQLNLSLLFQQYFKISNKFYFDYKLRAKFSTPQRQLYPLINGLGYGNNLVRGFELYVIDGQHTFVSRNTFKYQALNKIFDLKKIIKIRQFNTFPLAIYPNIYGDIGYVRNYFPELSNSKLGNRLLKGGGFGLDIVTWYNTNVKIQYAINDLNEKRFFLGIFRDF
jgi:outer membrane protein assembly factor BamA